MAQPIQQSSFNSGEWSPHLWARVDIAKYHSGAALLENFFVDYRGGASTRVGTKYVLQAYKSATPVRLIPFQASLTIGYTLEFGNQYVRFHRQGSPVLETGIAITGATQANPCVVTVANSYSVGDWVFISSVAGMTQLNGKYYIITAATSTTITLSDLLGNAINSTGYGAYTSGGTTARVYTLNTPYAASDLALLKFAQNINSLILCHPSYAPYILTYSTATMWSLTAITFGATIGAPTGVAVATTLSAGSANYSYIVTAVDINGQESVASTAGALASKQDIRTTAGSNTITWNAVLGAVLYNVYEAEITYGAAVPVGAQYGYIGSAFSTTLIDSNIAPDFSTGYPLARNPFAVGSSVTSATVGTQGSYTTAPTITFGAPSGGGVTASGIPVLEVSTVSSIAVQGNGYTIGDLIYLSNGIILQVSSTTGGASKPVTGVTIVARGSATTLPTNPVAQVSTSGGGFNATFNLTWRVASIIIVNGGSGYTGAPTITFSAGAATATANIGASTSGNPAVPAFFQQRLVLANQSTAPNAVYMSQPGFYYNNNVSSPIQSDDAIAASIVASQLVNVKALIPQPGGLIVVTDGASFLINGGSLGSAVTPISITSNPQSYIGSNDMPPIVSNFDILTVQSRGSSVRDSSYNFYANVFTGTDISIIASHLFFGYQLLEWAWAEEPYKLVWAVRNDGTMLSLTFLKEQEFTAWTHHTTDGLFKSVATIVEPATVGYQNFLYTVVQRTVEAQTLQYIEYMPERIYTNGVEDAVAVDCAYQYSGSPATNFTGATALAGLSVTGLADGVIIPAFTMAANGSFTLSVAASKVTVGLAFTAELQTLYLDVGDPTIQSKMKKIPASTIRVTETLGLQIGTDFDNLVDMKDLIRGNVGSQTNELVTDLVTGDARTFLDPKWQEQGVFCISQPYPYPASILGIVPQLTIGDTPK